MAIERKDFCPVTLKASDVTSEGLLLQASICRVQAGTAPENFSQRLHDLPHFVRFNDWSLMAYNSFFLINGG
jgi:hypothetical protein